MFYVLTFHKNQDDAFISFSSTAISHPPGRTANGGNRVVESDAVAATSGAIKERIGTVLKLYAATENRHVKISRVPTERRQVRVSWRLFCVDISVMTLVECSFVWRI